MEAAGADGKRGTRLTPDPTLSTAPWKSAGSLQRQARPPARPIPTAPTGPAAASLHPSCRRQARGPSFCPAHFGKRVSSQRCFAQARNAGRGLPPNPQCLQKLAPAGASVPCRAGNGRRGLRAAGGRRGGWESCGASPTSPASLRWPAGCATVFVGSLKTPASRKLASGVSTWGRPVSSGPRAAKSRRVTGMCGL